MLLSAILASISYRLSKLHNYVPLNSRTFLSPPSDLPSLQDSFDVGEPFELREESLLVTLDVRLRGTGTVIVSSSTTTSDFSCATPRYLYESEIIRPGFTDLWLSPSGRVARYVGPLLIGTGIAQDSISGPFEQKGQQMDLHSSKLQLWHFWKERVTEWLVGRGFSAATIEQEGWLIVQILMFQDTITDDEANPEETISPKPDKLLTISWPAKLCYLRRKPNALDTKLGWPVHSDHTDSNDPLKFAEEWFCSRQLRDDIIESGRSARQAQELLAQQSKLSETAVHDRDIMEEPFVRVSNYLDLQTASVMYPTPPDGTHIQGSTGPQLHVGIGSTPDNGDGSNLDHDAEAAVNPEHALAGSGRTDHEAFETGARRSSEISQLAMSSAAYGAAGEDLFADEDADADMFGTSGITEADFSFFDDPDLNDAEGQMFESIENTRSMGPDIYAGAATPHAQDTFADPLSTLSRGNSMPDHSPDQDLSAIAEELPGRSEERSRVHGHIDEEGLPVDDVEPYPNEDAPSGAISILEGNEAQDYRFSSPPLSPISIKKKLIPAMNVQAKTVGGPTNEASHLDFKNHPVDDSRRHCTFDPVAFAGNVDFSDQKYKPNGRFSIASQVLANKPPFSRKMDIPSIGFPKKKQTSGSWNKKNRPIALLENHDDFLLGPDLAGEAEEERSSFPGSQESDQDDSSYTTVDEAKSTLAIGLKRKRDLADSGDDLVHSTSQQLNLDSPVKEEGQVPATMLSLTHFSSDPSDWPFAVDNQRIGGDTLLLSHMNDEEYVRVAQILADQLSSSTLNSSTQYPPQIGLPLTPNTYTGSCQAVIAEVIKSVFDNSSLCDLETFAAIEDRSGNPPTVANNHLKTAKRTAGGSELQRSSTQIFKLQAPHIRVQRAETAIEVLPPALPFWESFGFGPVNGPKDVIAFCLYPPSEGLEHAISTFLEGLGSVYESCKLGSHVPGDDCGQIRRGLVPIIPNEANSDYEMFIGDLKESCEGLGRTSRRLSMLDANDLIGTMLGSMNAENSNIVVYMVNPFTHPGPIADLCAAFLLLYQAYMQSTRYLVVLGPNELVLQLVPISFIASKTSLVVPTQAEYRTLALQVYERCGFGVHPTVDTARTPGVTSSILLSENLPTRISLKLAAEPPSSVLHEQTCLHIAYSTNVKDRWLSASWTDSFGKHQMSVAYCLGLEGSDSRRPFADIAREIWETSLDIVRGTKAKWKFLVVKVGIMDAEELEGKP